MSKTIEHNHYVVHDRDEALTISHAVSESLDRIPKPTAQQRKLADNILARLADASGDIHQLQKPIEVNLTTADSEFVKQSLQKFVNHGGPFKHSESETYIEDAVRLEQLLP